MTPSPSHFSQRPPLTLKEKRSYTGQFLKPVLARKDAGPKKKGQKAAE